MGDAKLLVKLILVEFRQMYIKYCRLVFKISCFNDGEPALSLSQPCSPFLELHRTAPREKEQFNDCLYPPAETKREISKLL